MIKGKKLKGLVWIIVAIFVSLMFIVPPILWTLGTSFKIGTETISFPPQWIPKPFTLSNYIAVLQMKTFRFFINSVICGVGTIVMGILISVPAAYIAVRSKSPGVGRLMIAIIGISTVPAIVILLSLYAIFVGTALINTYPLLILVYTGMVTGQVVWFIRCFIENIPRELEEAAIIDGCSTIRVIRHVVLPLIKPGLASMAIYVFIFVWNDFLIGNLLTTVEEMRTVQVGLVRFIDTGFGIAWGHLGAYAILAFIPTMVLFIAFQNWFIAGLGSGALKS